MKIHALLVNERLNQTWNLKKPYEWDWISARAEINLFTGMIFHFGEMEKTTFVIKEFEVSRKKSHLLRLGHSGIVFLSKVDGPDICLDKSDRLWIESEHIFRGLADHADPENEIGVGILSHDVVAATLFALYASFVLNAEGILRIANLETVHEHRYSFPYSETDEKGFFSTRIPYSEYKNIPGEREIQLRKALQIFSMLRIHLPSKEEVQSYNDIHHWLHKIPRLSLNQTQQFINQL